MKKVLFILTIILTISFAITKQVEAHFLATDKNIAAVLHVDPDDDPIAGEQASFFFEFKDVTNKFDPKNCNCNFTISEKGNTIYAQPLFQNSSTPSLTNASVFYTFPKRDVYVVKVVGTPLISHAFQSFTLTWNFRVDQIANSQNASTHTNHSFFSDHVVHIILFTVILIVFITVIVLNGLKKKKEMMKGGEKKDDKENIGNKY